MHVIFCHSIVIKQPFKDSHLEDTVSKGRAVNIELLWGGGELKTDFPPFLSEIYKHSQTQRILFHFTFSFYHYVL